MNWLDPSGGRQDRGRPSGPIDSSRHARRMRSRNGLSEMKAGYSLVGLFSRRRRPTLPALILAALACCGLAGCKKYHESAMKPPPEVWVVTVGQQDVPIYHDWIGSLDGLVNAQIRAQVSGYLLTQNYREGDLVKKGDLLFQIDSRPFQAALDQAKGKLAQ